jgi:hypothetical protein
VAFPIAERAQVIPRQSGGFGLQPVARDGQVAVTKWSRPAFASLTINVGLGDVAAIRETFAKSLTESVSPISLCNGSHFLKNFQTDPEIDRMHRQLFGW